MAYKREAPRSNMTISRTKSGVDVVKIDTNEDVSDNSKLLRVLTNNVGEMLTQISQQMVEFEQMRAAADEKTAKRFDKIEKDVKEGNKHVEVLELVTLLANSHGKNHDAVKAMLSEATGVHTKHASKSERILEVMLNVNDGFGKMNQKIDRSLDGISSVGSSHEGLHGKVKVLDQRLTTLEKNGQESVNILRQMKQQQDDLKKGMDALIKGCDMSKVKGWIDDHSKNLHGKLDGHSKNHDRFHKLLDEVPNHNQLMKGVHGLLSDHLGDHVGKIMSSINRMPLPPDEKVMLQAIENMHEASLSQMLESMEKLKRAMPDLTATKHWLDEHSKQLHNKLDNHSKNHDNLARMLDDMPDHGTLMKGVHGLLADHLGDHHSSVMGQINKLPLPPDEKVLLQSIENMQEAALCQTLEAIDKVRKQTPDISVVQKWIGDHTKQLHDKLDGHSSKHEAMHRMLDEVPSHSDLMKGVHGLLADHLGDHHQNLMSSINKLPLPPDEKVLLQAFENLQEAALCSTLEAIDKLEKKMSDHPEMLDEHSKALHGKLDNLLDNMPGHEEILKGVHGLLGDHIGDHSDKLMSSIDKMPLPPDEKVLLQAIENMQEASLGQTLEAIEKLQQEVRGHTDDLHGKLDDHGKNAQEFAKMLEGMPDHDTLMKGVHGLLGDHLGDHSGQVMEQIDKLPLPPDEKVLLQCIENMEEKVMGTVLEAIENLKQTITGHADSLDELHGKLSGHGDAVDQLAKMMDGMPDHDTIMQGVHGLLGEHLGDGHGKIMDEINKLPLDQSQKVMLNAVENMEESVLTTMLDAIEKLQKTVESKFDDHSKELHGKLDGVLDGMPDHKDIMEGVHGLLGDHLGDHGGKVMDEINKLPLPPDEKVLLQAIENMQEQTLGTTLEAIKELKDHLDGHSEAIAGLKDHMEGHGDAVSGAFDDHGKRVDDLLKMMDGMPDHDEIMKGVHGLLGDHLGDHSGKVMDEINKMPLPPSEKVMLQAIENMSETVLQTTLEAIEGVKKTVIELSEGHEAHGQAVADLHKKLEGMPNHDDMLAGVNDMLLGHVGDGHGKIASAIDALPLDQTQKVMLQAMENMEDAVCTTLLEAIQSIQMNVTVQGANMANMTPVESSPAAARPPRASSRAESRSGLDSRGVSPVKASSITDGRAASEGRWSTASTPQTSTRLGTSSSGPGATSKFAGVLSKPRGDSTSRQSTDSNTSNRFRPWLRDRDSK